MSAGKVPDSIENFTPRRRVTINRPIYTEEDVGALAAEKDSTKEPLLTRTVSKWKEKASKCSCTDVGKRMLSFFPFVSWLPKYKKDYITKDLVAGFTLGVFQIPQGMAYGMLTTLPAIYGLYTSLVPVIVYFFMGTSRFLNIGTFAIISLMVGESVQGHFQNYPVTLDRPNATLFDQQQYLITQKVEYAVTLSFMVGIFQVIFGLLRFGFITIFLSDALISGFTTGAAFHIATSQVKHLVGMNIPRADTSGFFSLFKIYGYIFYNIKQANYVSFLIGLVAFIILLVVKHFAQKYKEKIKIPIPAELIVISLGLGLSYGFDFHHRYDVIILKNVPKGMPPITYPSFNSDLIKEMLVDSLTIALVSYAISVSISKAFAKKNGDIIDVNQELYAYGFSNIVSSFFSCFVSAGSLSRSLLQEQLGSTQVANVYAVALILLTLTVLAPIFRFLPNAILASIIMVALKGLLRQFGVVKVLFKVSKIDAAIWISSFIAVICCGVDYGLGIGFVLNLLATVVRASRPSSSLMGNIKDTEIYTTIGIEPANEMPGIKIFRFHAPLFYANTEFFQKTLYKATVSPLHCIKWAVPKCYQLHTPNPKDQNQINGYVPPKNPLDADNTSGDISLMEDNANGHLPNEKRTESKISITKVTIPQSKPPFCPIHTIILDCSQISYADSMGVGCLIAVCNEYRKHNVDVLLSHCPGNLLQTLEHGGFTSLCKMDNIFLTTHDAVNFAYLKYHAEGICGVEQQDKEEHSNWEMVHVEPSTSNTATTSSEGEVRLSLKYCVVVAYHYS
ncbi:prestin-like isoform X1 [Clytia hemisphaerica]|uniref:STAS domain-containing protein n=1 Tax=Clytia hemisphaerica TaxID=252671 RepID=A0A7M5WWX2_9CNID